MFTDTFTAHDLVAILTAINVPVCFTVLVAGVVIIGIRRAFQRSEDARRHQKHTEDMERLRLSNTKEITNKQLREDYGP